MDPAKAQAQGAARATQRRVLTRMIRIDVAAEVATRILALWLYLESLGCNGFLRRLSFRDDNFLSLACEEAKSFLDSLRPDSAPPVSLAFPATTTMASNPTFCLHRLMQHSETVAAAVTDLCNGLYNAFEDILEESGCSVDKVPAPSGTRLNPFAKVWGGRLGTEGGSSRCGAVVAARSGGPRVGEGEFVSNLNPDAKEWHPSAELEEESRCLFITFSSGFPISQNQIYYYFCTKYGACVSKIYLHQPMDGVPLFGKITFKYSFVPRLIMNGRERVKFTIGGRTMWCKYYRRRKPQTQ